MLRILSLILLFASLAGFQSPPQAIEKPSPDTILVKAVQSIGGHKALEEVHAFKLHALIRLADGQPVVEIDLSTSIGGKVLCVMTFIGVGQSRFGSDGTITWEQSFNSVNEQVWKLINNDALTQKVRQINWLEWFTMLPAEISYMEVDGEEKFDKEDCWRINIAYNDVSKKDQYAFFSKETFRPRGRRTIEKTPNGDATVDVFFRDWQRVGDLLLFHTVIYSRNGSEVSMKFDQISTDALPNSMFRLPEKVKELVKELEIKNDNSD
ncbi:MAG TPA: hypothetical protein EYO01_08175 [Phycisphaerales bacterium]|nr:hypothetical protein [Phycisphaerales bacterium]HIN83911.1 hypothetical protein [Phycisphaerales bacterium]